MQWNNEANQSSPKPEQSNVAALDEKAEFEQFKIWNQLRTNVPDSAEYQEFLQWLEYRTFKSGQ